MTLSQFAVAVGADPKWVQNAASVLRMDLTYGEEEAYHLGLVKKLHEHLGVSLHAASRLARTALAAETSPVQVLASPDQTISVWVDRERYDSDFSVALTRALHHEPRRRGRPSRRAGRSATQRAREYGIDVSLLDVSLRLTPAERLQRLDRNLEFLKKLRQGARRR